MIDIENSTSFQPRVNMLKKITTSLTKKDVELIITTDEQICLINKEFRNIDKPTDVLSFPISQSKYSPLGSIIISKDRVLDVAKELGHSEYEEFELLYIHGLLHLLGLDHEKDGGKMRKKESELIKKFNLPQSLIVRGES
ncbi:MAG: rRNA maturation RNase YbeY [Campylobacterota bacterium]|nr:rRNA maturation RNase YbeY [Campylobacterota bacterium]